jgi:hypothetical protein
MLVLLIFVAAPFAATSTQGLRSPSGGLIFPASISIIENSPKTRNKPAHNFRIVVKGKELAAKKIAFMIKSLIMNPGLGLRRNPDSDYLAFQAKLQNC